MGEAHSTIMSKLYDSGITVSNTQCLQSLEGIEYLILDAQPWITQGDYTVEKLIFDGRTYDVKDVSPHDLELDNLLVPMCLCNDAVWLEESRADPHNAYLYVDKKGHPHFEMNWTAMGRGMDSCMLKFVQKFRDVDNIRQENYPMMTYYFPHEDGQFRIYQALDGHFHEYFTGSIECVLKRCDHCYKDGKIIILRIQFLINLTRKVQIETGCIIRAYADYRLDECDENYQFSSDCLNFPIGFTAEDDDQPLSGYYDVESNLLYKKLIFIGFVTLTLPRKEDSEAMMTIMKCLEKPDIVPIVCTPWNLFYGYNIGKYSGTLTDDTSIDCILYNEANSYLPSHPLYKDPARIKSLVYSLPSNFEDSYWDNVLMYSDIVLTSCTPAYKLKLIKHLRILGKKIGLLAVSDRDIPLIDCVDVAICVDYASENLKEKCPILISDYNLTDVTKVLLVAREMNGHKKEYSRFFNEEEQQNEEQY